MHKSLTLLLILATVTLGLSQFLPANADFHPIPIVPAPAGVQIAFDIESPAENTIYSNGTIDAIFNVTAEGPSFINGQPLSKNLLSTFYKGDWMQEPTWCPWSSQSNEFHTYNFSIAGIPLGQHRIDFTGHMTGSFVLANGSAAAFALEKTVSISFFVIGHPVIEWLSPQNANISTSSFPLNFTVDSAVTEMAYILDRQEAITINGNTTLTDLPNGRHNVTVYATNAFGYTGTSSILFFNIDSPESFPVVPVIAVSAIAVVVGVSLLVYFKKRHPKSGAKP